MYDIIKSTLPFLLEGLWVTFQISIITIFCGSLLGAIIGMLRTLDSKLITFPLGIYIHTLRGTPFLIHLYFVYFMLPATGVSWLQLEAYTAAVIALSLNCPCLAVLMLEHQINATVRTPLVRPLIPEPNI